MKVQPGALIKIKECGNPAEDNWGCSCCFCLRDSTRVGIVIDSGYHDSLLVLFDCGLIDVASEVIEKNVQQL
jgi:hypothetical protein